MIDKSQYPVNWREISDRIRFDRAGGKCERCGAPHDSLILRSVLDPAKYVIYNSDTDAYEWPDGQPIDDYLPDEYEAAEKFTRVILTVHHIGIDGNPHDKMDCRDENLVSLCQRCHLLADLPTHIANARHTRLAKREQARQDAGQRRLL